MDEKIAKRWAKALRSGRYKQGRQVLREGDKHCCLGVLCRILRVKHEILPDRKVRYDGNLMILTAAVAAKAGIRSGCGDLPDNESLAWHNDNGSSFAEIADIIEANWKDL